MGISLAVNGAYLSFDLTDYEIKAYEFTYKAPNSKYAKSSEDERTLKITGDISRIIEKRPDVLELIREWAKTEFEDLNYYNSVKVTYTYREEVVRSITFPHAFIKEYRETISAHTGHGLFTLLLGQKADRLTEIEIQPFNEAFPKFSQVMDSAKLEVFEKSEVFAKFAKSAASLNPASRNIAAPALTSKNPDLFVLTDALKGTAYSAAQDANGTYYIYSSTKRYDIKNPAILVDKIIFKLDKLNAGLHLNLKLNPYDGKSLFKDGPEARSAAILFFYGNPSANKFRAVKDGNNVNYKFTSNIIPGQEYFEITQNSLFRRPSGTAEFSSISTVIDRARNLSSLVDKNMLIVLLAGINTDAGKEFDSSKPNSYNGFFIYLISYLKTNLVSLGYQPVFSIIYPYGVGGGTLTTLGQAQSVALDNKGIITADKIKSLYDYESSVILIGHSGGGVAGYDALEILGGDGATVPIKHLIMVGSPKVAVKKYKSKTTAIYDPRDEVVRNIGEDFEYTGGRDDVVYYKPGSNTAVSLTFDEDVDKALGGHMNYFDGNNYTNVGNRIFQVIKGAI